MSSSHRLDLGSSRLASPTDGCYLCYACSLGTPSTREKRKRLQEKGVDVVPKLQGFKTQVLKPIPVCTSKAAHRLVEALCNGSLAFMPPPQTTRCVDAHVASREHPSQCVGNHKLSMQSIEIALLLCSPLVPKNSPRLMTL